jgi:hypothetical protein
MLANLDGGGGELIGFGGGGGAWTSGSQGGFRGPVFFNGFFWLFSNIARF